MATYHNRFSACDYLLRQNSKGNSLNAKKIDSCKKDFDQELISDRLSKLPKIKAHPGFNQRMAAAFAMELEREKLRRNRSWLKKHSQIKLPEIISDYKKDLF